MRHPTIAATVLIAVATAALPCWSQDSSRIADTVFTNPGARSIGLGGAFAAIADDATAAFANPAGLVQILRPEISIEFRATASTGNPDNLYGVPNGVSGLGFFSFVYPSRNWAIAAYSHQMASLDFTFDGLYPMPRELSVRSYATAAALEISEHLSLGAGFSYFDGDRSAGAGVSEFSDADWGVNAGLLWSPFQAWNFAGFYRQGPEFDSSATPTSFSFPNVYGVGVAFQPNTGALTIGFEWDRVGSTTDPLQGGHAETEGGSEYHLGVEYAVLRWKPVVAFRAGMWRESNRRYDVINDLGADESFHTDDRTHVAFGFGLAFKRFQIDAGVDFFDQDFIGSASFVYSF